jgi:hypothetical protein
LPCTFDGWVHVLDFYIQVFLQRPKKKKKKKKRDPQNPISLEDVYPNESCWQQTIINHLLVVCFWFFLWVVYVYSCPQFPCTFDGWVPVLDFYLLGFASLQ